jgi:putative ABC transport system permease protein
MGTVFDFATRDLTRLLVAIALLAALTLAWQTARHPHLARIGLRNIRRRGLRTMLIVLGLMLSTTFLATALVIDDTVTLAVRSVAVYNLGRIDEDVLRRGTQNGLYPGDVEQPVYDALRGDPAVAGVAPALSLSDLLVADVTSRQVRGGVAGLGLATSAAGPLGALHTTGGAAASPDALPAGTIYLNTGLAQLLSAHAGDTLQLYSASWAGQRFTYTVRAAVSGGPLGAAPAVVLPLAELQRIAGRAGQINHIYIANAGDGLSGVAQSDEVVDRLRGALPDFLRVAPVKRDGVEFAVRAQDIFARILTLYTLFALTVGVLLIFLIFVLLAAERRPELGMVRVLGMRRGDVMRLLVLEGAAYDTLAALAGLLVGLALGALIVAVVSPTIARIGFPLAISVRPTSLLAALCVGLVFTLVTMWLAAWTVSRMTIAAALRDLPEPPAPATPLVSLLRATVPRRRRSVDGAADAVVETPRAGLAETLTAWRALGWALVARGFVPLIAGWYLIAQGTVRDAEVLFSLGLSCALLGGVLLLRGLALAVVCALLGQRTRHLEGDAASAQIWLLARATLLADRASAVLIGTGLVLYWSLPFDAASRFGLPRFAGGIEVFFLAGVMMVLGAVLALAPNLDVLLLPVRALSSAVGRVRHVTRIALIYPSHQRFRTGVGLAMFSFVCFTMVVMACIATSATQSYDNLPAQAAGYDIAGQPLFTPLGGLDALTSALRASAPQAAGDLATTSVATPLPLGMLQPGAPTARWSVYPTAQVQGAFLDGVGLPLVARAEGFASDAAVWQAVRSHPGDVVIDAAALSRADAAALGISQPAPPQLPQYFGPPIGSGLPGLSSVESLSGAPAAGGAPAGVPAELGGVLSDTSRLFEVTLRLRNVVAGAGRIAPIPLWVNDVRGGSAIKLTIVGIVENARGQRYGLFGSPATFAPAERNLPAFGNDYYYFQVKSGADTHAEARALGSALLDHGFETTVLADVLLDVNGPQVFISRVLIGLVGLMLFVGMAALAISGSRAVVERRQQIGMLRALGFRRWHVQLLFLIETTLVGSVGTALGLGLGLVLSRNVFAVDFFAPIRSGLVFVVPWLGLAGICLAAVGASVIAALLPAWQAGRIAPADALRYE